MANTRADSIIRDWRYATNAILPFGPPVDKPGSTLANRTLIPHEFEFFP